MNSFTGRLMNISIFIYSIIIMMMMFMIVGDVIGKYAFRSPIPGTTEIVAYYMMVACVFLPLGYVEAAGRAIYVEIISQRLGRRPRVFLDCFASLATLSFYVILLWQNFIGAMHALRVREYVAGAWNVTVWPSKFIIPLSLLIAVVIIVTRVAALLTSRLEPDQSMVEERLETSSL